MYDDTENWGWGKQPDVFTVDQLPKAPPTGGADDTGTTPQTNTPPPNPYSGTGQYENPAMQGHEADLTKLYEQYYGTSTPDVGAFSANLGNPGGLSAIEAMMKADSNNLEGRATKQRAPALEQQKASGPPAASGYNTINPESWFASSPSPLASRDSSSLDSLKKTLQGLYDSGGGFNQDIVNRRTENARENLHRQRKSTLANDQAAMAERGLIGSGPEKTGMENLDSRIADQYANAVSGIYANESSAADQRMMDALRMSAGLSDSDASQLIQSYMAQTSRALGLGNLDSQNTLGLGSLALGNMNGVNNYNLGLGELGLKRDVALNNADNSQLEQVLQLLQQLMGGAGQSQQGFY